MNSESWMRDIADNTPLSLLNIPGTHDSATQYVNSVIPQIFRCQDSSIAEQLKNGARFIDARLQYKNKHFRFVHSIADCRIAKPVNSYLLYFDDVYADIKSFLRANPSETVLLSVKMDDGRNTDVFYREFYRAFIEPEKNLWYMENRIPQLGAVRGKIILFRRCILGDGRLSSADNGLDFSYWEDQSACDSTLPLPCWFANAQNEKAVIQDRFRLKPEQKWSKAAVTMFCDYAPAADVMNLNFLSTAGNPKKNAAYINRAFEDFELPAKKLGIVIFDFLTKTLAQKIIQTNTFNIDSEQRREE